MYTVGSWFPHLMNLAILAIVAVAVFGALFYYKGRYAKEAKGSIMAEVRMPSGWDYYQVTKPLPDGTVRIGKGDYWLAKSNKEAVKEGNPHSFIVPTKRWAMYPMRPFMGLRWLQVPIRKESWYYGDPNPIMWPENQMQVTAVDAQCHTREMDAQNVGIRIQESEAREKRMNEVLSRLPDKTVLYIIIGGVGIIGVITLIQLVQFLASQGG